jgi:hypothetical protein
VNLIILSSWGSMILARTKLEKKVKPWSKDETSGKALSWR